MFLKDTGCCVSIPWYSGCGLIILKLGKDLEEQNDATLYFGGTSMNDIIEGHEAETGVTVIEHIPEKNGSLFLLKLSESSIHHISLIKRCLIFFRYYRKDGLTYQRFKSYVSAYSFPRRIRIVSFRDQDYYNFSSPDNSGQRFVRMTQAKYPPVLAWYFS